MKELKWISTEEIEQHPDNPRTIEEGDLQGLVNSLQSFPKMMEYRPILVDPETNYIIGGNQRHKAAKILGWEKVPVLYIDDSTSKEKLKEMVLKDNANYGDWNFDILKEDFEQESLISWGVEDARYLSFEDDFDLDESFEAESEYDEPEELEEDIYEDNQIKKIVINLVTEDYEKALEGLVEFIEKEKLKDASEALLHLLEEHGKNPVKENEKEPLDYVIAIPSYKRQDTLKEKTLSMLKESRIPDNKIFIFTASPEETEKYKESIGGEYNYVTGILTLCKQRKFIQDYFEEGQFIMFFDDDISAIEIKSGKELETFNDLEGLMTRGKIMMDKNETKIFSIYPIRNAFFMKENTTTDLKLMVGGVYGIINDKSKDLVITLDEKEDYERTALYYKKFGKVVRFNNYTLKTIFYKGEGGMVEDRTVEKQQEAVDHLLEKYPEYFEENKKRKSGFPEIRIKRQKR